MTLSLPLTTMEEFIYWEDRPAYPWSCFVRLRFTGVLDRKAFETAVHSLVLRHPLFTAKVVAGRRGRLHWAGVENPSPKIVWEVAPTGGPLPRGTRLDLNEEIGVRFHVRTDGANTDVIMQFHHSCCDGAGFTLFVREFLVLYALAYGNAPKRACLAELDPSKLAGRGRFGLNVWKLLRMLPQQLSGVVGARQFLSRVPKPLIPHCPSPDDGPLPEDYPAMEHYQFDRETTNRFRMAPARLGVTFNDLLARDLFLAIAEWRERHGIQDDGDWLRMMIPMNIRSSDDRLMPAANIVSSVFLDRRKPVFSNPDELLRTVHDEMELIKRLRLGYTFIFSTAICRLLFGGLKKHVRADKCTISCIFTNIGTILAHVPLPRKDDAIVAGNVIMNDLDIVVPVRPYSCATVAVVMYAHKLGVTLHYDPRPMTKQQGKDLLDIFVRRIRESASFSGGDAQAAEQADCGE